MGGWDLSCSRLLSSPLPACTTLLLCSARGVSGMIHSLISMWHSRLETPLGVGSRYAFLHQTSCIFSSSSISKPPLTLVNKTCMNPMTEYNLGKDRIQDKMPGEILPACTLTSEVCSQNTQYEINHAYGLIKIPRWSILSALHLVDAASPRTIDIVKKKYPLEPRVPCTLAVIKWQMHSSLFDVIQYWRYLHLLQCPHTVWLSPFSSFRCLFSWPLYDPRLV